MIARISGRLEHLAEASAFVDVGNGLWYELLVPACDVERLGRRTGQDVVLYTIHYMEGDPSHGQVTPRLIGFVSETDRDFFRTFTKVKGVGVRTALQALGRPVSEIAAAIEGKDTKTLSTLPGIGPRTAERIIADLRGKVQQFAGPITGGVEEAELPEAAEEAVAVLVQLGERRADAMALVRRVLEVAPDSDTAETIIQYAYRLKAGAT
ncbi:MAG: Holliday junction branch migration protein RuvA [Planctomycetota bacterium]|jgi:Holliday junction DNA helicase RuvA